MLPVKKPPDRDDNRLSVCHPSALAKPLMWLQLPGGARGAAMGIRYENRPVTPQGHKD